MSHKSVERLKFCQIFILTVVLMKVCATHMNNNNKANDYKKPKVIVKSLPAERRGPVTDQIKGVLTNFFSSSPLNLEVPKVKQMSQLLTQLFPKSIDYLKRNNTYNEHNIQQIVSNHNRYHTNNNKLKSLSNFGYAFDDSLDFVSQFNVYKEGQPIDADSHESSASAHNIAFLDNFSYSGQIDSRKPSYSSNLKNSKNSFKSFLLNNQTNGEYEWNGFPEYTSESFNRLQPTVHTIYGVPQKHYYSKNSEYSEIPTSTIMGDHKLKSSDQSIVVHYSQVEDQSDKSVGVRTVSQRPIPILSNNLSQNNKPHLMSTDNKVESIDEKTLTEDINKDINSHNLNGMPSQLNAIHYIEDLHNKTHMEFNKLNSNLNSELNPNNSLDLQMVTESIRQTFGISPEQKMRYKTNTNSTKLETLLETQNTNTHKQYEKQKTENARNRKKLDNIGLFGEKSKTVYSAQVIDSNFTGMDWKPILSPLSVFRPFSETLHKTKTQEMEIPLITENIQEMSEHVLSPDIDPVNDNNDLMSDHLMESSPHKSYYQFVESPHNLGMESSSLYSQHIALGPGQVYRHTGPIIITPKPVVHRIRDFLRNMLFANK